jgi:hypothetical protein
MDAIIKLKPWFSEVLKKQELQDITLRNLYQFYLYNDNILKILPIITSNSNISIRVLDWFVTNYSKKYNIIYNLNGQDINGDKFFNVFLQYKCQLKSYKKKLFDPFCRKQRIAFHYDESKCVVTTIGQLNFFRWAIKYGVLKYVEDHLNEITTDMISSNKATIKQYKKQNNLELTSSSDNTAETKVNSTLTSKTINTTKTNTDRTISSDSDKIRKKRQELSTSANKTINIHKFGIVLTFDNV